MPPRTIRRQHPPASIQQGWRSAGLTYVGIVVQAPWTATSVFNGLHVTYTHDWDEPNESGITGSVNISGAALTESQLMAPVPGDWLLENTASGTYRFVHPPAPPPPPPRRRRVAPEIRASTRDAREQRDAVVRRNNRHDRRSGL